VPEGPARSGTQDVRVSTCRLSEYDSTAIHDNRESIVIWRNYGDSDVENRNNTDKTQGLCGIVLGSDSGGGRCKWKEFGFDNISDQDSRHRIHSPLEGGRPLLLLPEGQAQIAVLNLRIKESLTTKPHGAKWRLYGAANSVEVDSFE
jgi:hypothetical protein